MTNARVPALAFCMRGVDTIVIFAVTVFMLIGAALAASTSSMRLLLLVLLLIAIILIVAGAAIALLTVYKDRKWRATHQDKSLFGK
ncbi:hypothetical protein [Dictyobacter arantiisoli]|uniref:hypothetical protein n=1 Tax=Dictyobacter arantiisoli TaxID=2014874 RepID=UPI0011EF2433|nr:hypothetical protein [Dictyobacter arantiisoli]